MSHKGLNERSVEDVTAWVGTIVFLHGKESTPETSTTARAIREHFLQQKVSVPDYRPLERTHEEIERYLIDYLQDLLDNSDDVIRLVGISLGGYWAYTLSCTLKGISQCVMLNPSFRCYPGIAVLDAPPGLPITLIANLDDEVVDPFDAIERLSGRAEIVTFQHGGHRFSNHEQMLLQLENTLISFLIY